MKHWQLKSRSSLVSLYVEDQTEVALLLFEKKLMQKSILASFL